MTYHYRLNEDEAVTVRRCSRAGGKIWIRARKPDRSPLNVLCDLLRSGQAEGECAGELEEHGLETAASSPKAYREEISWPG